MPLTSSRALRHHAVLSVLCASTLGFSSFAQSETTRDIPASNLDAIQVTADRFSDQVQEVPNSVEVIDGRELRARGVNDLRTALSLVSGVFVATGGDEGPAAAVPGLLGLREVDDFLLLVDGVPAGGVFIPQFATLDISNIERIEVQRGAAPVLYGTTAFAGTINIIHYAAGSAEKRLDLGYGTYGSVVGNASGVLSQGVLRSSLSLDGSRERYSDSRSGVSRGHLLSRNATDLNGGEARLDFDATVQHQSPGSPRPLEGAFFDPETPVDFNQNPSDGKINTNRFQLTGAYDKRTRFGSWGTTLSVTHTHTNLVQGFLNEDADPESGLDNATGFSQKRNLTELYFDTHITRGAGDKLQFTFGVSELYGQVTQDSQIFSYSILSDAGGPPSSRAGTALGSAHLSDWRSFGGIYSQARWNITRTLGLLAGLRLNRTDECRSGGDDTEDEGDDDECEGTQRISNTRLSGSLGINWRLWQDPEGDLDDVVLYASYGNTFQPSQIDFGPDDEGPLLKPETARTYEAGIKADGDDGRWSADLGLFWVDFNNQAVATLIDNTPGLASVGSERFKGAELELRFKLAQHLVLSSNYSYNDARYRDFNTVIEEEGVQLAGNQLPLSPRNLAGFGLIYDAPEGLRGSVVTNYVGNRFLDSRNTVRAGSYATVDANIGYAFHGYVISVNGYNLGDRRDPVLESELGEGQFYLQPGRRVFVRFSAPL